MWIYGFLRRLCIKTLLIAAEVRFQAANFRNESDIMNIIKIWLDDIRPAPNGYFHCRSVNEAKLKITHCEMEKTEIELIDCDHDLGDYAADGGDGIKLIDWLAERKTFYPIKLHTQNPVGRENMQREINRYWRKAND